MLNNIVHHNGYTGIAITGVAGKKVSPHIAKNVCYRNMGGGIGSMNGSTAVIENNLCFENFYAGIGHSGASPVVRGNTCHGNVRAGIGISEGASPTVTDNRCFKNRRAGIGIRTGKDTRPVVEKNECFENDMAGIGIEDDAMPVVRENRCHDNLLAGIGVQDGASPQLVGNVCTANKQSGIGLTGKAQATITRNRIKDNALVAIGVTGGSQASIEDNELSRDGGMPPMIAVLDGSQATISGNTIRGGGVAGVLVKGSAEIRRNHFLGAGPRRNGPPNFAVWVQKGASVIFIGNDVTGWRQALSSSGAAKIVAKDNKTSSFLGTAFVVKDSIAPVEITGNTAISDDPDAKAVEVTGAAGDISHNELKRASPKP